jgi:hypothetical protein
MDPLTNITTTVEPYLPDCLKGRLDNDFDIKSALDFDPASFDYYKVGTVEFTE